MEEGVIFIERIEFLIFTADISYKLSTFIMGVIIMISLCVFMRSTENLFADREKLKTGGLTFATTNNLIFYYKIRVFIYHKSVPY